MDSILNKIRRSLDLKSIITTATTEVRKFLKADRVEAKLAKETQKEKALAEIIDKIRRTLNIQKIFDTATEEVCQLLDADRVGIFQFHSHSNYEEGEFVSESVIPDYKSALGMKVLDRCFGNDYVNNYQENYFLAIEDIYNAGLSECHRDILANFQIRANLILPIAKNKKLWGLLCIHQCSSPRKWEDEEIEFLRKIIIQLEVALQQTELLSNANSQTQELQLALVELQKQKEEQIIIAHQERTIARIIESMRETLDIETVFKATTQEIRQTLNCDRTVIYRFFPNYSGEFVFESMTAGWTPLIVANIKTVWLDTHLQETQGGRYANHETFAVNDIYTVGHQECHLELLEIFQIKAYIIAPVFAGDKLWGLLATYQNTAPREWQQYEINLLSRIGAQLGVAIQQHQLLQSLEETTATANAANAAKSEFLANMSHELRTPLNAILGFTQLLAKDSSLTLKQQEYLSIIGRSGEHLLHLLNDVLEMSKIEAGRVILKCNDFDLIGLLKTLEDMFQLKAQSKGLKLSVECSENLPQYIYTDESKLRQILINLIGNAIKFTKSGYVIIRCTCLENNLSLPLSQSFSYRLYFEVEDTGNGIAPDEIDAIFNPFVQSSTVIKSNEGTGLGLAISKKFVNLMGGNFIIKSTLNQGSTFSFDINVNLAKNYLNQSVQIQQVIGLELNQPTYRILIVDDKFESRLVLVNMISPLGLEVQEAENGQQALEIWENWQPHLIWMDMRMPIMDGYTATRKIRWREKQKSLGISTSVDNDVEIEKIDHTNLIKLQPDVYTTKIIALTASVFEEQRFQLYQAGCNDFVPKPFREQLIYTAISEHLGVRFVYEEKNAYFPESVEISDNDEQLILFSSQISELSPQWREKMYIAALGARETKIKGLIQEIGTEYPKLSQYLKKLVKQLAFDQIATLTINN